MGFIKCSEKDLENNIYSPLKILFILIKHKGKYLFVHRRQWDIWEIPVGEIYEGETYLNAAARICKEKSCQSIVNTRFLGIFNIQFEGKEQVNYAVAYTAEIHEEMPFIISDDVTEIRFVSSLSEISPICMTCRSVVEYYETGTTDFGFSYSQD